MPSKKKYNARFPPARIKKIMQTDEDVGKVAAPVPVLISKALEIFLESLIIKSSHQTLARNAKTMTTAHIKQCIQNESTFDFLKDLVENVPDIAQGDDEDVDNNHSSSVASNNNRYHPPSVSGSGEGTYSRSSSTASSSSYTEGQTKPKRRRGRPRKQRSEDIPGPSRSKPHKLVAQSSEDRTTSEDSEISDNEGAFHKSETTTASSSHPVPILPVPNMSQSSVSQDSRQRHPESTQQLLTKQPTQQPSFGQPVIPQFQLPTAPTSSTSSSAVAAAMGMGLYQMPTSSGIGNNQDDDDDDDDDYDT